jgi:hypothetical protein
MTRGILGVMAGLAVWMIIVTIAGAIMRSAWPAYASVADAMTFTLPMMIARLSIGACATLAMGYVTAVVARQSARATLLSGVVLLLAFIPEHISIWNTFPVWYHLTFLFSLVPLSYLGGTMASARRSLVPAKAA